MERRRIRVSGVVQGVGFRPFVHRLAVGLGVSGFVGNDDGGVFIEAESDGAVVDEFMRRLATDAPRMAVVAAVDATVLHPRGGDEFAIVDSGHTDGARTGIPPDVATCPACLADVHDSADRRHRYPFTNCTDCGPRLTVICDLPYDRPATTMAGFAMCAACAAEYTDPADRRFHAQPIACPACGPQLRWLDAAGAVRARGTDASLAAVHLALASGAVVAVKGVGGYHLACDAENAAAVAALRLRKGRPDKPLALMVPSLSAAATLCEIGPSEARTLQSAAAPIVLLRRRSGAPVADGVAPGNPLLGVMLPYSPLHHLLFEPVPGATVQPPKALVLTSGNLADEPLCHLDADALARLAPLVDGFLVHDRPIEVPVDDSVVRVVDGVVQPVRRARGYAPVPVALPVEVAPVLAVGGEVKNTFCVAVGRRAWVSQHVGDMGNLETLRAFERSVGNVTRMYALDPQVLAVDLHPGYSTRRWAYGHAAERRVVEVQHHHAHVASLMVEHGLPGTSPVFGVAFDGTGYGAAEDGSPQLWGGEVLLADYRGFRRLAHLRPLPLPGGDAGVRHPCRAAVAALAAVGIPDVGLPCAEACEPNEREVVLHQVGTGLGCVPTTSMGRLFDVVASLLGVRHRITYEAQAAIELEALAETPAETPAEMQAGTPAKRSTDGWSAPRFTMDCNGVVDSEPVLRALADGLRRGRPPAELALAFHRAVAEMVVDVIDLLTVQCGRRPVALTGGVFQNSLLTRLTREGLVEAGHTVLTHRFVPANDGGLALGQAVIAGVVAATRKGG